MLNITKLSRHDAGIYTCEAVNSQGAATINISVSVHCKYIKFFLATNGHVILTKLVSDQEGENNGVLVTTLMYRIAIMKIRFSGYECMG